MYCRHIIMFFSSENDIMSIRRWQQSHHIILSMCIYKCMSCMLNMLLLYNKLIHNQNVIELLIELP